MSSAPYVLGVGSGVLAVTTSPVHRAVTICTTCGSRGTARDWRLGATRKVTMTYALSRIAMARAEPSDATTPLVALASLASRVTLPTLMAVSTAKIIMMPMTTNSSRSVKARAGASRRAEDEVRALGMGVSSGDPTRTGRCCQQRRCSG